MLAVMLAAMLMVPNMQSLEAYLAWDELARSYDLPPLALRWEELGGDGLAAATDFDAQGRANIVFDFDMQAADPQMVRKVTAHEAFHTLLRRRGVEYGGIQEERLANGFAYCWLGTPAYFPVLPCAEISRMVAR